MTEEHEDKLTWCSFFWITGIHVFFIGLYFTPLIALFCLYHLIYYPNIYWYSFLSLCVIDFMIPMPVNGTWRGLIEFMFLYEEFRHYPKPYIEIRDCENEIKPDGKYCIAFYPHGVYPVGATMATEMFLRARNYESTASGASVLFYIPLLRRYLSFLGVHPATKKCINERLKDMKPGTIWMQSVGGISEMFLGIGDHEEIIINRRNGWLQIVLQNDFDGIIPVYCLGTNQCYTRFSLEGSFLQKLSSMLQISVIPFYGRFFFAPWRVPMCTILGNVISTKKVENPTADDISELKEKFKTEVKRIYYKGRDALAEHDPYWKDRDLMFDKMKGL